MYHRSALRFTALASLAAVFTLSGCAAKSREPIVVSTLALGTQCSITVYERKDAPLAEEALSLVGDIEERMSVRIPNSEVSRVNAASGTAPVSVSADTFTVIERGLAFSRLSSGHFDITIGPVVSLWGIGTENPRVPAPEELAGATALTDYTSVILDPRERSVYLPAAGQALDLGGIAKGWAIAAVVDRLRTTGVKTALINFGGNVCTIGTKADGSPWRIGIQDPWDLRGTYIAVIAVGERSVATSGKYERYFTEGDRRYHHILDTETGWPVENGIASVSIVDPDPTRGDALSTAVFSMGIEEGYALLRSLPEVEGVIVTEQRGILVTPGLSGKFTLKDDQFVMIEAP